MDYSTVVKGLDCDADGVLFDVHSLYACLLELSDQRGRQGRRYTLALILLAVILAKLGGEDKPEGIADWVRARQALLVEGFQLTRPTLPSANTYRRALNAALVVEELEEQFGKFLSGLPSVGAAVQITLDGKTLRGTIAFGETRGLHLIGAYLPHAGVVLFEMAVDTRTNEITAAPQVIKMLDLQGKIVTGDALYAQRELSEQVVQAGGDYIWSVKDNQPRLREDIEQLFQPEVYVKGFSPAPNDFRTAQTVNKGHGRIETRTLTTSSLLTETSDWPGIAQVFKLERETTLVARAMVRREVAYGVTSLTTETAGPDRLLTLVRGHWGIENGLHYRRDKTFKEDEGRMTYWPLAQAMAAINNLVVALLLNAGMRNLPKARRHFAAHPDQALNLLLTRPS